jgi:hypothetical protein
MVLGLISADRCLGIDLAIRPTPIGAGRPIPREGGGSHDPNAPLAALTSSVADALEALVEAISSFPPTVSLDIDVPVVDASEPFYSGWVPVTLKDGTGSVAVGQLVVLTEAGMPPAQVHLELAEGTVTRRLWLLLGALSGNGVRLSGLLLVDDGFSTSIWEGGWLYTEANGLVAVPDSQPEFFDEVATMFHVLMPAPADGNIASRGFSIATAFASIAGIASLVVNYILDLFIPYEPPTTCLGPIVDNGNGGTCSEDDVACADQLAEACAGIDDLPGVSTAFKKCMKGRCGCGGSRHRRARVSCDFDGSCGVCTSSSVIGCNLPGGTVASYCHRDANICSCLNTTMHELSHGCGTYDGRDGTAYDAYRIGDWFQENFEERIGPCVVEP